MKERTDNCREVLEGKEAYSTENILFNKSILSDECRKELKDTHLHEIVVKICEVIGPCPSNLRIAEEIFEGIKYDVANYLIHHEYNSPKGVSADLLLWLDSKTNPSHVEKFSNFMSKFFR